MIITEVVENRVHTFSDIGMKIRKKETGEIYDDAMDNDPCPYTYEETNEPVDPPEEDSAEGILNILLGEAE